VLALPDNLVVYLFHFCGVPTTFNAALACRQAHAQLWQSPTFWLAFLQLFGASEASLRIEASLNSGSHRSAVQAFRRLARHLLFGIDILVGKPVQLEPVNSSLPLVERRHSRHANDLKLEDARRAILAMLPEDEEALIQRATDSVVGLLRNRGRGECELLKAEQLLEAVAGRCELFSTGQMLDMLGAHQKADEAMTSENIPKAHPNVPLRPDGAVRSSRRARRAAAVAA
jgi:hypothetical protein